MAYKIISAFVCRDTGRRVYPGDKDYVPSPHEAARLIKAKCLIEFTEGQEPKEEFQVPRKRCRPRKVR